MAKKQQNNGLIAAILFAAVAVSGSVVYLGMQLGGGSMSDEELAEQIQSGITAYVENAQAEYEASSQPQTTIDLNEDLSDDDPFKGDADAPLTIVEFSNYQCGWCQYWAENVLPLVMEKYVDAGLVKFVYRDFTPNGYPAAYPAALAANSAC